MAEKQETGIAVMLKANERGLRIIASKYMSVPRLLAVMTQATMRIPKLAQCTEVSILEACRRMAECGTDRIGAGGMWLIPFEDKSKKIVEVTAWPDWRLIVENAKKAGAIKHASADVVYSNDVFSYKRGMHRDLIHEPSFDVKGDRGKPTAVYCVYELPDGEMDFSVMTWKEVEDIRGRGAAWKAHVKYGSSNPWVTDEAEMAKKTIIKRAMKIFEGASAELSMTMATDNTAQGFADMTLPEPIAEPKALAEPVIEAKAEKAKPVAGLSPKPESPASVPASPADDTEKAKQNQIISWGMEMSAQDGGEAEKLFIKWTRYTRKDKSIDPGVVNPFDLKNRTADGKGRLDVTLSRAQKDYFEWKNAEAE